MSVGVFITSTLGMTVQNQNFELVGWQRSCGLYASFFAQMFWSMLDRIQTMLRKDSTRTTRRHCDDSQGRIEKKKKKKNR